MFLGENIHATNYIILCDGRITIHKRSSSPFKLLCTIKMSIHLHCCFDKEGYGRYLVEEIGGRNRVHTYVFLRIKKFL